MNKTRKITIVVAHFVTWACFFALPFVFVPFYKELNQETLVYTTTLFFVINTFLVSFYYTNTLFLIPRLLFLQKWGWYLLVIGLLLLIFLYIPKEIANYIYVHFFKPDNNDLNILLGTTKPRLRTEVFDRRRFTFFPGSYIVFLLVFTIGTCISLMQQWLNTERLNQQIENEKLLTELSFLKSQINPHFFFNTLNSIYSLAILKSEQTATSVLKLSQIMRYILNETKHDKELLQNEIEFIHNYLDLQSVRMTDNVKVNFKTTGDASNVYISPLLFIPFIENAFKYGVSTKEACRIDIRLDVTETKIYFSIVNNVPHTESVEILSGNTGIGIQNVKRRLELLYNGKHILKVNHEDKQFKVLLEIELK